MNTLSQPFIRRLALTGGTAEAALENIARVRVFCDENRLFRLALEEITTSFGGKYRTIPAGSHYWQTPNLKDVLSTILYLGDGPDWLSTGDDQIITLEIYRRWVDIAKLLTAEGSVPAMALTITDRDSSAIVARYSDTGYAGDSNIYYLRRLLVMKRLNWAIGIDDNNVETGKAILPLENLNNEIADLAAQTSELYGFKLDLYLKYRDLNKQEVSKHVYGGLADIDDGDKRVVELTTIGPLSKERMAQMQRSISIDAFPNAREEDLNTGMNLFTGTVSSGRGALKAAVVDEVSDPIKLAAAQGYIKSVDQVYRLRGDAVTLVAAGFSPQADAFGDIYTKITVAQSLYQEGDRFYFNGKGIEDGNDGTGTLISNAADAFKELLIRWAGMSSGDFDVASWNLWAVDLTAKGYDSKNAIVIPWMAGQLIKDTTLICSEVCKSFDVGFWNNYDGTMAVAFDLDVSTTTADLDSLPNITVANLKFEDIKNSKRTTQFFNSATVKFGVNQSSDDQVVGNFNIRDDGSVQNFKHEVQGNMQMYFLQDRSAADLVASSRILRAAGRGRNVLYPAVDLLGLDFNPGQRITLSHPNPGIGNEPWDRKEMLIWGISMNHMSMTSGIQMRIVGETFGPLVFPGESTTEVVFDEDLWINKQLGDTNYNGDTSIWVGDNIDGLDVGQYVLMGRVYLGPLVIPPTAIIREVQLLWRTEAGNNGGNPPAGRYNPLINGELWENVEPTWEMATSTYNHYSDGGVDRSAVFDGVDNTASALGSAASLKATTGVTINGRLLADALSGNQDVANKLGTVGPNNVGGYGLQLVSANLKFQGKAAPGPTLFYVTTTNSPMALDSIAKAVFDGAVQEVAFYVDGVEVARGTNNPVTTVNCVVTGTIPTILTTDDADLTVASRQNIDGYYGGKMAWLATANFADDNGDDLVAGAGVTFYGFENNLLDSGPAGNDLGDLSTVAITYADVPGGAPWTDNNFGAFAPYLNPYFGSGQNWKGAGPKIVNFNADGVAYINSKIGDTVELLINLARIGPAHTGDDVDEWIQIMSRLGTDPWRLGITYLLP